MGRSSAHTFSLVIECDFLALACFWVLGFACICRSRVLNAESLMLTVISSCYWLKELPSYCSRHKVVAAKTDDCLLSPSALASQESSHTTAKFLKAMLSSRLLPHCIKLLTPKRKFFRECLMSQFRNLGKPRTPQPCAFFLVRDKCRVPDMGSPRMGLRLWGRYLDIQT
jgi:hypothetical protein